MRLTRSLWNDLVRVTLFTRDGCGLCDTAKASLIEAQKRRPFNLDERDIMQPDNKQWRDVYDFDVPVVCLFRFRG